MTNRHTVCMQGAIQQTAVGACAGDDAACQAMGQDSIAIDRLTA